jgi:ankyrin repeat protein
MAPPPSTSKKSLERNGETITIEDVNSAIRNTKNPSLGLQELSRLLDNGINPNQLAKGGLAPLHVAARMGNMEAAIKLLEHGAYPNIQQKNYGEATPLHLLCTMRPKPKFIEVLLTAGADPNKQNVTGDTPLHITCAERYPKLCKILLMAGADETIKNVLGNTPMDLSLKFQNITCMELLQEWKARKAAKNAIRILKAKSTKQKGNQREDPNQNHGQYL